MPGTMMFRTSSLSIAYTHFLSLSDTQTNTENKNTHSNAYLQAEDRAKQFHGWSKIIQEWIAKIKTQDNITRDYQ